MSTTTVTRPDLARRARTRLRELADSAHADGDAHARGEGWTVTATPGTLGLAGRTYRDPRFGAPRSPR